MFAGMSQEEPHHGGRGRVGSMGIFSNGLKASETGLAPAAARKGSATREAPPRHVAINTAMRARTGKEMTHSTRRHVDPVHVDFSDEQKRQEGRLGKAHVDGNPIEARARAFYRGGQQPTVELVPGQQNNLALKSYQYTPLSKQERSPPPKASAHQTLDDLTSSRNPQLTSIQLAEARLRQMAQEAPRFRQEARETLHTYHGYPEVVSEEQKLSRLVAVDRYYEGSSERVASLARTRHFAHGGSQNNLGAPSERIEESIPFALQSSAPRGDNVEVGHASGLHITRDHNKTTQQQPLRERKMDRHLLDGPVPYDSTTLSREAYPSPPKPGVSQGLYSKRFLVQHNPRRTATCHEDRDTLTLKRAREARCVSHPQSEQSGDFIFGGYGTQSASSTPNKMPATLKTRMETKCAKENEAQQRHHTGVAMVGPRYKKTALW